MIGPYLRSGAVGALNAVGNLVPGEVRAFIDAALPKIRRTGDADACERALAPLVDALRAAPHPIPLKESLALLGAIQCDARPPLAPLSATALGELRTTLEISRLLVPEHSVI